MSSAKQSHHAHQTEILRLLDKIKDHVKWHCDSKDVSWSDVGDLVHVENTLTDIEQFMKGRV